MSRWYLVGVVALAGCTGAGTLASDTRDEPASTSPPQATVAPFGTAGGSTSSSGPTGDHAVCADGSATYSDIQAAIDASAPGETISVCPGTYGPIEVRWGQDVILVSTDGPERTTIDGGDDTAVLVIDGALDLTGFRLTGTGRAVSGDTDHGGALTVKEGAVSVRSSIVEGVTGRFGMVFDEDLLVLEDVAWTDNTADILWFFWQGDDAIITRNTVSGGVHESVILTEKLDQLHLRNSVFAGITIDAAFTALDLSTSGTGPIVLENNVFYDIDDLDPWGGRVFSGDVEFRNNIVVGCDSRNLVPFDASYSIFWDNLEPYAAYVSGTGNQFVDPQLVDPANGDFHLSDGSPAVDAGDPDPAYDDLDGSRNDIGRYGGPTP